MDLINDSLRSQMAIRPLGREGASMMNAHPIRGVSQLDGYRKKEDSRWSAKNGIVPSCCK
jgi:hypothetical protein